MQRWRSPHQVEHNFQAGFIPINLIQIPWNDPNPVAMIRSICMRETTPIPQHPVDEERSAGQWHIDLLPTSPGRCSFQAVPGFCVLCSFLKQHLWQAWYLVLAVNLLSLMSLIKGFGVLEFGLPSRGCMSVFKLRSFRIDEWFPCSSTVWCPWPP